jgi:hypothetical protein
MNENLKAQREYCGATTLQTVVEQSLLQKHVFYITNIMFKMTI